MIAMSGGVDSSVAALLALDFSDEAAGCTLKLFESDVAGLENGCCSQESAEDARSVAYGLGMKFYVFSEQETFREKVLLPFARDYEQGRTPNPCIECNRNLKFGLLYDKARTLGYDCLVTGHYARIVREGDQWLLKKALDETKDQSYVLYMLSQEQLAHIRFPLGELRKTQVRQIAAEHGFGNAEKADSQDLCFAPDGDYAAAAARCTGRISQPGQFLDLEGNVLGQHRGIVHYTVGQRRGLGQSFGERAYVVRIDPERNAVIIGPKEALFSTEATVREFHWISGSAPEGKLRCAVKTRYRQAEQPCTVEAMEGSRARILFDRPQRAVTPCQAAVLYDGDTVLGGGILE